MGNRVLQMKLKEIEENYKKAALLNPRTREEYIRRTREMERIEKFERQYYRKKRLLG